MGGPRRSGVWHIQDGRHATDNDQQYAKEYEVGAAHMLAPGQGEDCQSRENQHHIHDNHAPGTTQRKEDGPDHTHDQHDQAGQYAHAPFTAMMNQAEIRGGPELLKTLEQRWFGSH